MATWTLTYDGTTKTFAAWGLKGLQRSQASQSTGSVRITQSGAPFDGAPLFATDAVVTISKDGTPWHVGPVITDPRAASARSEQVEYEIADPWWYLEQLTYEQPIAFGTGTGQTTRISLFGGVVDGVSVKLSVENVISSAVALAVAAGAEMQVAFSGSFGISPPMADMRDPTCAEIIRAALRWVPDATAGWDYSTTPPTLRIATRAAATARTIDLADKVSVNLINITPRDDLRRERVMIYYEITSTDGEETYTALVLDNAGSGSPFRTLKATLPLSGPQTQRQSQWLETEAVSPNSVTWWKRHVPSLAGASELSISDGDMTPAEDGGGDFSMAIVDGQVPGWLDDPESPISGSMRVSAKASYKIAKEDGSEVVFKDDPVSVVIACTDLTTDVYSRVTSYTFGEPVPSGIAAALLAALSVLQYDGSIKIKRRECSFIARPGDVLQLTNGDSAWATARMLVQRVTEDVDAGQTVIQFGPPKHLSPQDIVEMLRTLRGKPPVYNVDERVSGKKGDGNRTQGSTGSANDNGSAAAAAWHKVVAKSADGRTMTLSAEDGVKLENDEGAFIDHDTANQRTLYQDAEGNSCNVKASEISLLDAEGNGMVLNPEGVTITNGDKSTALTIDQLVLINGVLQSSMQAGLVAVTNGTESSELAPAALALNDGAGKTNNVTAEAMTLVEGGDTTTVKAGEASITNGTDALSLKPIEAKVTDGGGNYSSMSAEGGLRNIYDGQSALMYVGSVKLDDGGGGLVDITPVPGKSVSLKDTDMCEEVEDVMTTLSAVVLRSDGV